MVVLIVVVAIVVVIAIAFVAMYNSLVRARHAYQNAYAQIDVQLTRRHDLIPNLVEVAKAYMRHEQQTLGRGHRPRARAAVDRAGRPPRPATRRRWRACPARRTR